MMKNDFTDYAGKQKLRSWFDKNALDFYLLYLQCTAISKKFGRVAKILISSWSKKIHNS